MDSSLVVGSVKRRPTFFRTAVAGLVLGAACITAHAAHADPIDLRIVSDGTWKSSNVFTAGWQDTFFDDSGWVFARDPYPPPQHPIPGSSADNIWYDPSGTSDGTTGSIVAYFRKTFTLNIQPDSLPLVGQALISVDDDYEFYVNGHLAQGNYDQGFASLVQSVDFTAFLQNGQNVFAIIGVDGGWSHPYNRGGERVTFDATITTVVPEPNSVVLSTTALIIMGTAYLRWRHRGYTA